tara:strand:+ start:33 stop:452 length:420 start_codon:yes stop_codon:yes gene_type:complete
MEVELGHDAIDVSKRIGKKGIELKASVKKALLKTALQGINIIEDRTKKGRGLKGFFPKYSPKYLAFRASKGRGKNVDLQFTGQMLGSITAVATSNYAEIYFSRGAESKKAAMVSKKRPFFGFSRREKKQLGEIFFKALK